MPTIQTAVFGGGCFWCIEAVFQRVRGVRKVTSGYAGGSTDNPGYGTVSSGQTGHAEVVQIEFAPEEVSYRDLLEVFFTVHDPTTLNRQSYDVGPEYRSIILYTNAEQKQKAEDIIREFIDQKVYAQPIVTELKPLEQFYPAEDYHKNFYNNNKYQPYCQIIINPKLKKFKEKFASLVQPEA